MLIAELERCSLLRQEDIAGSEPVLQEFAGERSAAAAQPVPSASA